MEKPIGGRTFLFLGAVFLFIGFFLLCRTGFLQVVKGRGFAERSENNRLRSVSLAPERGFVYDRNGEALAWNTPAFYLVMDKKVFIDNDLSAKLEEFLKFLGKDNIQGIIKNGAAKGEDLIIGTYYDWSKVNDVYQQWSFLPLRIESVSLRAYKETNGLAHVLGYMGYSSSANNDDVVGKAGVEKSYENILRGEKGVKITEVDSLNNIKSESLQKYPAAGENIKLSVDYRVQKKLYEIFSDLSKERGFQGAAGVILDIETGEILAIVSYPEYDSLILSRGGPEKTIQEFINNPQKPFLNRAISGLYAPGSVVKPFLASAALNEGIITPDKKIFSAGSISIPNPYLPGKESVFRDWKAHGWVDMREALAVSSDVYFYSIGGGYGDVAGLGIKKIEEYMKIFGFGVKTGINLEGEKEGLIPSPELKKKSFSDSDAVWRIGDTYNASIGQGDFQVTSLQMAVATAVLANGGYIIKPQILLGEGDKKTGTFVDVPQKYFDVVKEGMRMCAMTGTAQALGGLSVEAVAKTGTAELGSGEFVNSWVISFWPYEKPRYAASVVLERGKASNLVGGVYALFQLLSWMQASTPEYIF